MSLSDTSLEKTMVRGKKGAAALRKELEDCRRLEEQLEELSSSPQGEFPPKPKRPKLSLRVPTKPKSANATDQDDLGYMTAENFEKWWDRLFSATKVKEMITDADLKHLKRMLLIVYRAQLTICAERIESDPSVHLAVEFDSTPHSSRIASILQKWCIDKSSSVLNFEISIVMPISDGFHGSSQLVRVPIVAPCYLLPKSKADSEASAEKLFMATGKYLKEVIEALSPDMESPHPPLQVMLSADWASDNRLCLVYLVVWLSAQLPHKNYTLCITRCCAHILNNNSGTAATAVIRAVTKSKVKDVVYSIWKRCQLLNFCAIQCDNYCAAIEADKINVREVKSVGKVEGCRYRESSRFMGLVNCGEEKDVRKKMRAKKTGRLGFFEEKIVWIVGEVGEEDEEEDNER